MTYRRSEQKMNIDDDGVQKGEIIGKLRNHLQKVIQELDRVNRIALQQEDQIEFLRSRLDEVVKKCNSQAYLIHDLQEKLRIMQIIGEEKMLEQNEALSEEERKKMSVFVESVFENRSWNEEGRRIEDKQKWDELRMKNIQLQNMNEGLISEREVLVDQIRHLQGKKPLKEEEEEEI